MQDKEVLTSGHDSFDKIGTKRYTLERSDRKNRGLSWKGAGCKVSDSDRMGGRGAVRKARADGNLF